MKIHTYTFTISVEDPKNEGGDAIQQRLTRALVCNTPTCTCNIGFISSECTGTVDE